MLVLPPYRETRVGSTQVAKTRTRAGADYVKKGLYVLYLPAFSLNSTWRGASEIIREYKYSISNKISLTKLTAPSNPRFVACIAWKPTSETIVRYKLWEDVGEILYVPLYEGQKINADFSIEIWNVKPTVAGGGLSIQMDQSDELIILDQSDDEIVTDGGELVGTIEEVTHSGTALFHTSLMFVPTGLCDSETREIDVGDTCTDMTFAFGDYTGSISDDFIPFDGDYYNVVGDCGVTELIKGERLVGSAFKLQSSDDTWHNVFVADYAGRKHLFIDQANTTPGDEPFFYLRNFSDLLGYKIHAVLNQWGRHAIMLGIGGQIDFDYNVVYLLDGALYYGLRVGEVAGVRQLMLSQVGVTI